MDHRGDHSVHLRPLAMLCPLILIWGKKKDELQDHLMLAHTPSQELPSDTLHNSSSRHHSLILATVGDSGYLLL